MNLAIYGDSFADTEVNEIAQLADLAWPILLRKNFSQVHNYALAGTSLFYSMDRFERTHAAYDRVIFVVTTIGRWPGLLWAEGMSKPRPIPGILSIKPEEKFIKSAGLAVLDQKKLLRTVAAVESWYMDAQVRPFEDYIHGLMLDRIAALRPDAIIVPIHAHTSGVEGSAGLTDFALKSVQWFKPEITSSEQLMQIYRQWEEYHQPSCHLTAETHEHVYQAMLLALEQGLWRPQVPQEIVHAHHWDYYWRPRC
jgi:hypothetical protein